MTFQILHLVSQASARIANLNVQRDSDRFSGTISLDAIPPQLKHLFKEFEEMVEGQMFSLADEIEQKIAAIPLKVVFENGTEAQIEDLQVYPSTQRVSFKVPLLSMTAR